MNDERTEGKWTWKALSPCPLPGYGYAVESHAQSGAVWPVALTVTEADARWISDPDGWEKRYRAVERLKTDRADLLAALKWAQARLFLQEGESDVYMAISKTLDAVEGRED